MYYLIAFLLVVVALVVYAYFGYKYDYWSMRNVMTVPHPAMPWGHFSSPFSPNTTNLGIHLMEFYEYLKLYKQPHGGLYIWTTPVYLALSLDIVRKILVKDYKFFDEKGLYYNERAQPISAHMYKVGGGLRWRCPRPRIAAMHGSAKLEAMLPNVVRCVAPMMAYVARSACIDIKRLATDFTIDVVGNCAFGISLNSFCNSTSDFYQCGRKIFDMDTQQSVARLMALAFPTVCDWMGVSSHRREVEKLFARMVTNALDQRANGGGGNCNDFISFMLQLQAQGKEISKQDIIAHTFLFFAAGFECCSATLSHLMFEVAQQNAIQYKMHCEIVNVLGKYHGHITCEAMREMTYLSQVIEEAIRMYPPISVVNRRCCRNYRVPHTNVVIQKGTQVFIPTFAIHWDQDYFPTPHIFDPERFHPMNKTNIPPYAYLGFGEGPRQGVGMKFAKLQLKVALIALFYEHNFRLTDTISPLLFDKSHVLNSTTKIFLVKQPWRHTMIANFLRENNRAPSAYAATASDFIYKNLCFDKLLQRSESTTSMSTD